MRIYDGFGEDVEYAQLSAGAVLLRESRSGVTQNYQLLDGRLVSLYTCKSGRIVIEEIAQLDDSLTVRY